ncbi:MAG: hypothetical protein COX29_01995 [Candidatus Moranbacteria bacterium CG23_combo_of_CG06-09_8_20_14_all_35_22]|nr:MAG: hypothetical protein COX29_01995 [Candidatus Moranbacteria bacterium CG23_combo_of_CG06-09_8_20_14_all_35_22]
MTTNKMANQKNVGTFKDLFDVILNGNKENSRKCAREVRKFLYSSNSDGKFDEIALITEHAPEEYFKIKEDWRGENFVIAVSVLYYLHGRENPPNFLFPWLLHLLQHKNGNIRHSAVRMLENELGPLTVHLRCPEYKQSKIKSKQSDFILFNLYIALNNLLADLWEPRYKKYTYVASLTACPYKSIQMVMGKLEYDCGEECIKQFKKGLF